MRHECDCGAVYSNLDALMACQNANHGVPRQSSERNIAIEDCAQVALKFAGQSPIVAVEIAKAIRKLKTV